MKKNGTDIDKIERALIRYHRRPVDVPEDVFHTRRIMARIIEESRSVEENSSQAIPATLVWRFAFVALFAALLFSGYTYRSTVENPQELAELTISDSGAVDVLSDYGML